MHLAVPRAFAPHVAALALGAAVCLWGTSFVATKAALAGFPPLTVVGLRMLLATALMLPMWSRLPPARPRPGDGRLLIALAVLYPCAYFVLEANAINLTTASQAGAVTAVSPLLIALGAHLFLGERFTATAVAGLGLSIAGVVTLSLGAGAGGTAPNPVLGNVLELAAMAVYAAETIILKRLGWRYGPWRIAGIQVGVGAAAFLPPVLLTPPATFAAAPPSAWAGVAFLGAAVTLFAIGLYNVAVGRLPAARAGLAVNLVPVVAILTGAALLGETLTVLQAGACAVILGGVVLGERGVGAGDDAEPAGGRANVGAATRP